MNKSLEILVVGAGVVGLSAALALQQRGYRVAILDAGDLTCASQASLRRVYALNPASIDFFQSLGIWDQVEQAPYTHMHIWDAQNGAHMDFDARMVAASFLGSMVVEAALKNCLLNAIDYRGIERIAHTNITGIETLPDGILVTNGTDTWSASLLIGADGQNSIIRKLLNVPMENKSYQQLAIVTSVHTVKPHQHTAYQIFSSQGTLAFLPLQDPYICSIVWSLNTEQAEELMQESDKSFEKKLAAAFENHLGACSLLQPRQAFPLQMRHVKQYQGDHWLLMGDAAHTIHPLAGLGLNLGLADVVSFLKHLQENPTRNLWSKRTLAAYQRERKFAVSQTIVLMQSLKDLFSSSMSPLVKLRGLSMRGVNQAEFIKRWIIGLASY